MQLEVSNLVFYGQHAVESLLTKEHKVLKEVALRGGGGGGGGGEARERTWTQKL